MCLPFKILNLFGMLSSWGSSNYRPTAPFLYEVASHDKNCHFGDYYYLLLLTRSANVSFTVSVCWFTFICASSSTLLFPRRYDCVLSCILSTQFAISAGYRSPDLQSLHYHTFSYFVDTCCVWMFCLLYRFV